MQIFTMHFNIGKKKKEKWHFLKNLFDSKGISGPRVRKLRPS